MLKGIPPLLTADLLHALRSMGHGDEIAIVDANFPAASLGPPSIDMAGASAAETLAAILAVFPVDAAANPAAITMEVEGDPGAVPAPVAEFAGVLTDCGLADCEIGRLPRRAFRDRAAEAFAIVRTGELRPYGNILLVKGVVHSPQR
jgi:L-fucose mutarotase